MKKLRILLMLLIIPACTMSNHAGSQLSDPTVQPVGTLTPKSIMCTVTAIEALNLRDAPGTSAAVIGTLKHGDLLTILPRPAQGNWIYIRAGEREGWINKNYCKLGDNENE